MRYRCVQEKRKLARAGSTTCALEESDWVYAKHLSWLETHLAESRE